MTALTTQIINNGASLKIIADGATRNILKQQIREVSVINDTVIKIDIGQGALNNIFLNYPEVSNPVTPTPDALVEAINAMLQNTITIPPGIATEANQQTEISKLESMRLAELFEEPQISDEANAKTIYRGYAVPGSKTSDAVWAVEKISNDKGIISYLWADGNKNFDKVWDSRKAFTYK
jgi:hypothetical protein